MGRGEGREGREKKREREGKWARPCECEHKGFLVPTDEGASCQNTKSSPVQMPEY